MIIPNSVMTKTCVTNHAPASRSHVSTIRLELDDKVDPKTVQSLTDDEARHCLTPRRHTNRVWNILYKLQQ